MHCIQLKCAAGIVLKIKKQNFFKQMFKNNSSKNVNKIMANTTVDSFISLTMVSHCIVRLNEEYIVVNDYINVSPGSDLNECGLKPRPCEHRCMNTFGSFMCYCLNGYMLMPDGSCASE